MLQTLPPFIIYIHGFKSSPASFKARYLTEFLDKHGLSANYFVPELSHSPAQAITLLQKELENRLANFNITLIGSSLGGYYATFLTERYGVNSVLINPAVAPYRMLADNLGIHHNYHTQRQFEITRHEVDQLERLEIDAIRQPEKYMVLLQTGDEALDYSEAAEKYAACNPVIEQGGSHGFDNFERVVPKILAFAGMGINPNI